MDFDSGDNKSAEMEVITVSPTEELATGRRHLAVRDYKAATLSFSRACQELAMRHGEKGDQCAEAYLWYGKALLGLSREETGVLGDAVPVTSETPEEDDIEGVEKKSEVNEDGELEGDEEIEGNGETEGNAETEEKGETEENVGTEKNGESEENGEIENRKTEENKPESSTKGDEPTSGTAQTREESVSPTFDDEDPDDNLQLAWEMLELARLLFDERVKSGNGGEAARALLADVHLSLGEVALESETYDKAVNDMQTCLDIQKELYSSDDRRIAETHYQIGLAHYLASNFDEAITHFKSAANILESRIKTLETPGAATEDATVKKYSTADPHYTIEGEIKELKDLLPQIQEKIQDMMDYKAETIKRVREVLGVTNGDGASSSLSSSSSSHTNGAGSSSSSSAKPATNISHLIKRKRKSSENEESSAAKRVNT